ncbi:TonB-dependent receptor [Novosphingobium barchaimii LL02]|uniref:TonB-dependent receptor n=1 Tax=Novosphingobium barchaimii LL02 TaxID=1114963 RepID=A0A0J7Y9H4_9SPHN|nr:TonB-dependent receptor [Novosphingobium barchaimii]KMS60267.1 TonB-dependent receptor [Novosphingobium barchaimii LL02]
MKKTFQKAALRGATCLSAASLALFAIPAFAQDTTPQAADEADADVGEAIVVTGSRIQTGAPTTAAPVQVLGSEQIQSTGSVNIQETLLKNPVFGTPTYSRTNTSFSTSGAGLATVDLRNLGIDRTLVLINGRRVVSGVPGSAAVDLNMIPVQMLDRVETLTSGSASAVYGSDAVAGVVNFVLKDDFQGMQFDVKSGIAETGDNYTLDTSVMLGGNFDDGRGNATLFVGYSEQGAAYMRNHKTEAGRSDVDSISALLVGESDSPFDKYAPYYSGYIPQGTYYTDNGAFTYGPGGALQPCVATNVATCSNSLGTGTGPTGFNRTAQRYLAIPVQRYSAFMNAHYDVTDSITAFLEGSFVSTNAKSNIEAFPWDTSYGYADGQMPIETLFNGVTYRNPYVPDAIFNDSSDTNGDGLRDIFVTKRLNDFGNRTSSSTQNTFRVVGGFRGEIAKKWNFEVFGNYGQSNITQNGTGQINVLNFVNSQQIIPDGAGGYQCASEAARQQGCVPANVFGTGSLANALDYLQAPSTYTAVQKQTQVGGNISGGITNPLGADDIGISIGAEYRREAQDARWDALQTAGLNGGNALPPTVGSFDVKEVYGEARLPLVTDSFVHDLSIRGAARYSKYSTVGGTFSWNAGAEFAPIRDVRFRAMYAQTVRAPNIAELFAGRSQDFPQVQDPCVGIGATGGGALGDNCRAAPGVLANIAANGGAFAQTQSDLQGVTSFSGGNPNLSEEKGKTLTLGMVVNPVSIDALRNLTLTVDYFRVKIQDAIVQTDLNYILNQCYNNNNLCDFIVRRPAVSGPNSSGSLDEVNSGVTNSGGVKTSGIDVTVNYTHSFDLGNTRLNTSLNVAYTHLLSGYTIPLVTEQTKDYFEGEVGAASDRFTANLGVGTDGFRITATGTYIGASWIDDQFDGYHAYKVHPEFYLDLQARFFTKTGVEFFVGMDNVFDNDPIYMASVSGAATGMESDTGTYDPLGRRFYAGAKVKF